jgi:hypothetical protein
MTHRTKDLVSQQYVQNDLQKFIFLDILPKIQTKKQEDGLKNEQTPQIVQLDWSYVQVACTNQAKREDKK